jgi:hypothetical protein
VVTPAAFLRALAGVGNDIAGRKVDDIRPDINDLANKFMPDRRRHLYRALRPCVPVVNMQVRTADAAALYADHHVVDADFRFGNIFEPQARFGMPFN